MSAASLIVCGYPGRYTASVNKRWVMLCSGTRGDIQPHVALGARLRQAGNRVCVATHLAFRDLVEANGLEFAPLSSSASDLLSTPAYYGALTPSAGLWRCVEATARYWRAARPALERVWHDAWLACQDAGAVIGGLPTWWASRIAEARGIPCVFAPLQPLSLTRDFPSPLLPSARSFGPAYNRLTYRLAEYMLGLPWRSALNRWRMGELGLRPVSTLRPFTQADGRALPCVYGFSPRVAPRPVDWPEFHQIAGYWHLNLSPDWQPPVNLMRFIEAGDPPVYIGFGSYPWRSARLSLRQAVDAVERAGMRAVVLADEETARAAHLPPSIYATAGVSHEWLFPRVSVVVHHAGAGTVAAALRTGVPMITAPIAVDQFFWSKRVERLGVGRLLRARGHSATNELAELMSEMIRDPRARDQAQEIQQWLAAEDGLGRAVEMIRAVTD